MNRTRAAAQIQMNQRLVRERDRRHSRELWRWLVSAALLAVPVIGYVGQRMDFLRVSKKYEGLQQEMQANNEKLARLTLERATLMDHERIERLARQRLGLIDPAPDDVRNVRLFDGRVGAVERSVAADALAVPMPILSTAKGRGGAATGPDQAASQSAANGGAGGGRGAAGANRAAAGAGRTATGSSGRPATGPAGRPTTRPAGRAATAPAPARKGERP